MLNSLKGKLLSKYKKKGSIKYLEEEKMEIDAIRSRGNHNC